MNTTNRMTKEQALNIALTYAGIDTEPVPYQEALHFAACGEESFIAA